MRLRRISKSAIVVHTLIVGVAFGLSSGAAEAASCTSLKSELNRLQSSSAKQSPAARKWSSAKKQQQKALSAAQRDAGFFGCASASTARCQALNTKIKRMTRNLAAIERQLAKAGGGGSSKNSRRLKQVRAQIAKQNCDAPGRTRDARKNNAGDEKPKSFFSRLFSSKRDVELASAKAGDRDITSARSRTNRSSTRLSVPSGGKFKTLCVRTCDGYFFPLSYSIRKDQVAYDVARCSEICPAAETELYVYRNPGGDQSSMMSLAGNLYSEQPFAYRYKSEYVEGCSCRQVKQQSRTRSAWQEVSTGTGKRIFLSDISAGVPRRTLQPSRGGTFDDSNKAASLLSSPPLAVTQLPSYEDPDTLFNLEKGFDVTVSLNSKTMANGKSQENLTLTGLTENGLPLLRRSDQPGEEVSATSPVFKSDDPGFRPAPDRDAPVRVVGPEYFVSQ